MIFEIQIDIELKSGKKISVPWNRVLNFYTFFSSILTSISKIWTRCVLGPNRDPYWIGFMGILSPWSPLNSSTSGVWAQLMVPNTPHKKVQNTLTKFQKVDPQTRHRRVRTQKRAQNIHQTIPLGVSVQPEKGSGGDFWDVGFTLWNFGKKAL